MRASRGFTLVEMLFTCLLLGTVLTVTAGIFRDYSRILKKSQERDSVREAAEHFSFLLQRDALSSFSIQSPAADGRANRFEASIFRPREDRFNSPSEWTRDGPENTEQISYFLRDEKLLRIGGTVEEVLLEKVSELDFSLTGDRLLTTRAILGTSPKPSSLDFKVYIPIRRLP